MGGQIVHIHMNQFVWQQVARWVKRRRGTGGEGRGDGGGSEVAGRLADADDVV